MAAADYTEDPEEEEEVGYDEEEDEQAHGGEGAAAATATPDAPLVKSKPTWKVVSDLEPGFVGFSLRGKVMSLKPIISRLNLDGSRLRISEALLGDSSGMVILSLRNDQLDQISVGDTVLVRNAKIDMVGGFMRVAVDRWGLIEKDSEAYTEEINEGNKVSEVEYELVNASG